MVRRLVISAGFALLAVAFVNVLPDLARYLKIREM